MALLAVSVLGQVPAKTDALEILPARVELTPGEATRFGLRIRCSGLVLPTLRSSCTAGILEDSGRYLAPMEPGVYQIQVWAIDRTDMIGTATVMVLPKRLPTIERFDFLAPSQEVIWKVGGAQEVHLDPGPTDLSDEGQTQVPPAADWITLWATNDTGSVSRILHIPLASSEAQAATALPEVASRQLPAQNLVSETSPSSPTTVQASPPLLSAPVPAASDLPWTLQVMVLAEEKSIQKIREGGYLNLPGVFLFAIDLDDGRRAACICYGRYATRQDAVRAIRRMPREARPTRDLPYPRTVPTNKGLP